MHEHYTQMHVDIYMQMRAYMRVEIYVKIIENGSRDITMLYTSYNTSFHTLICAHIHTYFYIQAIIHAHTYSWLYIDLFES